MNKKYSLLLLSLFGGMMLQTTKVQSTTNTVSQNEVLLHPFSGSLSSLHTAYAECITACTDSCGDKDSNFYGCLSVEGRYARSWNGADTNGLGSAPLWAGNGKNTITIGNSSGTYNADAYQFGLGPVTTTGTLTLSPKVWTAGANFSLYLGKDRCEKGWFARIHGAVSVLKVDPKLSSKDVTVVAYDANSLANSTTTTHQPFKTIGEFFTGVTTPGATLGDYTPINYGKINGERSSGAKFGDLEVTIGYNFMAEEKKHFGIGLKFTAPTANKSTATYIFEPVVGRADHWGLGGEMMGHYQVWSSDTDDKSINFWFNGYAMHLFKESQIRSFDLKVNGAGSKWLLVAKYNGSTTITDSTATASDVSVASYQSKVQNLINVSTLACDSTFDVEGGALLALDYCYNNKWKMGLGYEFWGRSREKLTITGEMPDKGEWAILGRQRIGDGSTTTANQRGYSDPTATIGKSLAAHTTANTGIANGVKYAGDPAARIANATALDSEAAEIRATHTSKVFAHLDYTFEDCSWCPYISVNGGAEFSTSKNNAPHMWHVGLSGGVCF